MARNGTRNRKLMSRVNATSDTFNPFLVGIVLIELDRRLPWSVVIIIVVALKNARTVLVFRHPRGLSRVGKVRGTKRENVSRAMSIREKGGKKEERKEEQKKEKEEEEGRKG